MAGVHPGWGIWIPACLGVRLFNSLLGRCENHAWEGKGDGDFLAVQARAPALSEISPQKHSREESSAPKSLMRDEEIPSRAQIHFPLDAREASSKWSPKVQLCTHHQPDI